MVLVFWLGYRWCVLAYGPLALSQSKQCVLLTVLNRRKCSGSSRRMEAEGANGENRDTELQLSLSVPAAFSTSLQIPVVLFKTTGQLM